MSESDKAEFIQDNADLFSDGKLLEAFESGNYAAIEEALKNNEALQKQLDQRRKEVEQELLIEEARTGADRNEAYIKQLKEYQEYLNNTEELFKASLEVRLEQEKNQLDEYKSYLEDQQDALEDSLNKRKEAYEKYFDAINQNEEDEEYEEQANLLISNLSKLSSTSNASAAKETQELEAELRNLEEERLKELRERAQEAILENMDDELAEISEKFDKLLESNQALLAAMQGDLDNPLEFVTNLMTNKIQSGATKLEMEDYIGSLQSTYGNVLGSDVD
jgi:chromosome segregation ATPase